MPYHWAFKRNTFRGREYFGYLDKCAAEIGKLADKNDAILDAGCGDGRFVQELIDNGFKNITGVDYSQRAINHARILAPLGKFIVSNLENLPFANREFKAVTLIETLEHISPEAIPRVISELQRITDYLIITVPSVLLPLNKKHYQHFTEHSLAETIQPFRILKKYGQDKVGFHETIYKLFDNRYWLLHPLVKFFNLKVYPKYFNLCRPNKGKRIIAVCRP